MTFPANDIYLGPTAFGMRKGHEGIIWHTTEAAGTNRSAAVGTANWQKTNPGSYNFIIYDGGVLLTVPYMEASGGVNPASSAWAPGRFPWLKQLLTPAAYVDPNAYLMNIAFSGKAAELAAGNYPANMIDTAARLVIWFEASAWGKDNAVMSSHANWQSNRSDPGAGVVDRILARYEAIKNPPAPVPVPVPAPVPPPPVVDYKALYEAEHAKAIAVAIRAAGLAARIEAAKAALG